MTKIKAAITEIQSYVPEYIFTNKESYIIAKT